MGRGVRLLMKIPAVRRVMLRLWNVEDAIAKQQAALDAHELHRTNVGDAIARQQAVLDALEAQHEQLKAEYAKVESLIEAEQSNVDKLAAEHLQPAMRDAVQAMQAQIDALTAQLSQLRADGEKLGAGLAEVSQHLPPAHRMNLEATLHGQQLQLGALNSTITAQQMQLAALNDIVRQINAAAGVPPVAAPPGGNAAANAVQTSEPAAVAAAGIQAGRPAVRPYSFEQLLSRQVERFGPDLVLNIHVPKTGGHTVNALFRQMGFVPLAFDMNTKDFFGSFREDVWLKNYAAPSPRNPYLLTGHMRLDQSIFRRLWMQHVVVTVLRDPIERMISNYNFMLRRPANPWHDEVVKGGMSFVEFSTRMLEAIGPQYSFFDDTGQGTFARTGTATAQACFDNLLNKVSYYGLTDRFDEFAVTTGYVTGRARILALPPMNVTKETEDLGYPPKTDLTDQERDALTTALKDDIWFYQQAVKEYERRMSDPRLQAVMAQVLPLVKSSRETMSRVLTLDDPTDPSRRTFRPVR